MPTHYPGSAQNRRSARTRDPVELQVVGVVTGIAAVLAIVTVLDSPLTGPWSSPLLRAFLTGLSLGLVVPKNFGYILVFTLAFAVLTAFVWRWALRTNLARTAAGKTLEELMALSPDQFEEWVAARFEDLGYAVRVTGMEADHGVDLLAEKPGEIAAVQCKKYRNWTVGEPVLRDLLGAIQHYGANRAYLVTTGRLTEAAIDWARGKPIEIWDGEHLAMLSLGTKRMNPGPQRHEPKAPTSTRAASAPRVAVPGDCDRDVASSTAVTCPECGTILVVWQNDRTRQFFLGCSRYPHCHYTRAMP